MGGLEGISQGNIQEKNKPREDNGGLRAQSVV